MTSIPRRALLCIAILAAAVVQPGASAQETYKVKRGETLFGISRQFGITVDELVDANPGMGAADYKLKKGTTITIPATGREGLGLNNRMEGQTIKVGVVLPLHDIDGDGRRMTEYYRGLLIACNDLKRQGMSIEVTAYNAHIGCDMDSLLAKCSLGGAHVIFGPLYTKQLAALASYASRGQSRLVIPFSINGNDVDSNPGIFQVHKTPEAFNQGVIRQFVERFKSCNVIVVDCADRTSDKGSFTSALRKALESSGVACRVTSVNSPLESFSKAFSASCANVVVPNTARSPELNRVFARLDSVQAARPALAISLFGYTEWLMYEKYDKARFFKYDTYIPTNAYYNPFSAKVRDIEDRYRKWFGGDMMEYLPRFALTGYDHGMFFLRGLYRDGTGFTGAEQERDPVQTPLRFTRSSGSGGYRNAAIELVHYNRNNSISIINF